MREEKVKIIIELFKKLNSFIVPLPYNGGKKEGSRNFIWKFEAPESKFGALGILEDGIPVFNSIVEEIRGYAKPDCELAKQDADKITEIILKRLFEQRVDLNDTKSIKSVAQECFAEYIGAKFKEWEVLIPIENVVYLLPGITSFGDIEIGTFEIFSERDKYISRIGGSEIKEYDKTSSTENLFKNFSNKVLLKIKNSGYRMIEAVAKEEALGKAKMFTNTLSIFIPFRFTRSYRCSVDLEGYQNKRALHTITDEPDFIPLTGWTVIGPLYPLEFDLDFENILDKNGFRNIIDIGNKKNKTALEKGFIIAIKWFARGERHQEKDLAFFSYINVFEALFNFEQKGEDRSISDKISEGVAFTLTNNLVDRKNVKKELKRFYSERCAIVHGGEDTVDNDSLASIRHLAVNSIFSYVDILRKFKTPADLINYFDELRLK